MSKFEESNFYKALQDFFINADKKTFLQFLAEFYNRTEGIIDKNNIQDELIKELRDLYLEFNEKGVDENIVREKVNYFLENNVKIKNIIAKLDNIVSFKKGELNNNTEGSIYLDSDITLTSFSNNNNLHLKSNNNVISSNKLPVIFKGRYLYFENLVFDNTECVNISNATKVVFKNCIIRNSYRWGILISNTDNLIIDNCEFENNGLKPNLQETNEGMGLNCDR